MTPLQALNLHDWIDRHRHVLKPPVGNKRLFEDGDFITLLIAGPNSRQDYHVDPGQELFYQLEGDIVLKTLQDGRRVDVQIRQGEILLLPANVPHSPQRPAGSVGLVVERRRLAGERDGFQWYCERCGNLLHEDFIELSDIESQLPPVFERFYASRQWRTCSRCGAVLERPG